MTSGQNTGTAVEFQQMAQMSVAFKETAAALERQHRQVGEIRSQATQVYQGDAQPIFQRAAETWQAHFAVVIKSCHTMAEELETANRNYTANDSAIQQSANDMSSQLQGVLDGTT